MIDYLIAGLQITLDLNEVPNSRSLMDIDPLCTTILIANDENTAPGRVATPPPPSSLALAWD